MSKIYEIVFNTDPCQAFLMDSNSMLSHKFVVAHVLGHNDFFKNNIYFEHTDRRMIEKVRLHGNRIRKYEEEFGPLVVEEFLDAVLSIEEHFDTGLTPISPQSPRNSTKPTGASPAKNRRRVRRSLEPDGRRKTGAHRSRPAQVSARSRKRICSVSCATTRPNWKSGSATSSI